MSIPKCKIKDKGTLIHNLCKVGKEDILTFICFEELFETQLLFITQNGFIKLVSGAEFDTNRSVIASTKLDNDDSLIHVIPLSSHDILSGDRKVLLLTEKELSLGFPLSEVAELKKSSRGVKAITLDNNDHIAYCNVVSPDTLEFTFHEITYQAKKIKNRKRGAKGTTKIIFYIFVS